LVSGRCKVAIRIPGRRLDAQLVEKFEPEAEIEEGRDQREKCREDEQATRLGEQVCGQAEGQEDEHEGDAGADHLHAVAHGIGVLEQKHSKEEDEQAVDSDGEEHAPLQPLVVEGEGRTHAGLLAGLPAGLAEAIEAAWRFSASFTA
jgi:hypothetical protein